jgi:hypothetical protein
MGSPESLVSNASDEPGQTPTNGRVNIMDLAAQLIVFLVYFLGFALCMWRAPQADNLHVFLCLGAAVLWGGLFLLVPDLWTRPLTFSALIFFVVGLQWRLA